MGGELARLCVFLSPSVAFFLACVFYSPFSVFFSSSISRFPSICFEKGWRSTAGLSPKIRYEGVEMVDSLGSDSSS